MAVLLEQPAGASIGGTRRAFYSALSSGRDHHRDIEADMPPAARCDKASAALVGPQTARLAEDTLVSGGRAGRTPMGQGTGRTIITHFQWLAGGGIKGGMTLGQTDELGYCSSRRTQMHVHDLHATLASLESTTNN
jgi:hypothetical protein